jgi:hypothetical protein
MNSIKSKTLVLDFLLLFKNTNVVGYIIFMLLKLIKLIKYIYWRQSPGFSFILHYRKKDFIEKI